MLEPEGIVEIKFRQKDIVKAMYRVDTVLKQCKNQLSNLDISPEEKTSIEKTMADREKYLTPMYHQVAVHFADLHDTPERMQEKGAINVSICNKTMRLRVKVMFIINSLTTYLLSLSMYFLSKLFAIAYKFYIVENSAVGRHVSAEIS